MKKYILTLALALLTLAGTSAKPEEAVITNSFGDIHGTLLMPDSPQGKVPLVILIAGSGPTDRNGNNPQMVNNSLLMLADSLAVHGIASLRYDKRGIAASAKPDQKEADLVFDDFVDDARGWVRKYAADSRFSKIFLAGHSEGSLIALASMPQPEVAGIISIAGAGRPLDVILKEQLYPQLPEEMRNRAFATIDTLKSGQTTDSYPKELEMLFRTSVQPFVISVLKYDPRALASRLPVPMLVLQGTTDIQVKTLDADILGVANIMAMKVIIPDMNHVLKMCPSTDMNAQLPIYNNPSLPLSGELVKACVAFIK